VASPHDVEIRWNPAPPAGVGTGVNGATDTELLYVGDPMCSWCWGIAPELERVTERRPDIPLRIIVGGLRPGPNAVVVGDRMAASLRHHWREVEARSGQPFAHDLLDGRGWLYDTEPPCRAVVTMRELDESQAWPLFKHLQHLFYAKGVIVSDPEVYVSIISEFDVDLTAFLEMFHSETSLKQTWRDFATVHRWGIGGFPTLIVRIGERGHVVTRGYTTAERMLESLSTVAPGNEDPAAAPAT
jgi:putative protein-disulfide isomerase